ncbi:MAG: response regulator [Rubinisphaera brasiliensis]|uniref:Response regulator receiver protein n=1 Tax=Rubinisphaera brasiliensis (strain ATCC 49424 / DSM 5305 / JCM 21570 / IAM 15109 / NBRC 103401 / IFAM 1448) TaxID=756272 RepID=F0SM45_RUBBR|nr:MULTISPECIES: response regulator [Rubinisphaera]ADY61000.1 response regulator receiver protein [Rubinisphaera brasiliensis DSM 5305]MBR9802258.1 response regulator [bacterium]
MKILLVDDSATMRTIQKRCLIKLGVTHVHEAEDGAQALSFFKSNEYDIVFTDWNMPNMDGLELLQAIRAENREIPVIMITTESERSRVVAAVQAGVSDYLVKPFTPDSLRAKLEKWIGCQL